MADYISQFTGGEIDRRLAKVSELEAGKQDKLVSGETIKTIGGQSVLGEGNIPLTDQEAVKFTPQTLTDAQKAQALANIGAASEDEVAALADQKYEGPYATTDALPTASASTMGAIYLVGPDGNGEYDRYVTKLNGSTYTWGSLGKTSIDLSNYATKAEVGELEAKVDGIPDYNQDITIATTAGVKIPTTTEFATNLKAGRQYNLTCDMATVSQVRMYFYDANNNESYRDFSTASHEKTITPASDIVRVTFYAVASNVTGTGDLGVNIHWDSTQKGLVTDVLNLKPQVASNTNDIQDLKEGIVTPSYTMTIGAILPDGTTSASPNYSYSSPISMKKGQKITVYSQGYGYAAISKNGTPYIPLATVETDPGSGNYVTSTYIADENVSVVVCVRSVNPYNVYLDGLAYDVERKIEGEIYELVNGKTATIQYASDFNKARLVASGTQVEIDPIYNANYRLVFFPIENGKSYKIHIGETRSSGRVYGFCNTKLDAAPGENTNLGGLVSTDVADGNEYEKIVTNDGGYSYLVAAYSYKTGGVTCNEIESSDVVTYKNQAKTAVEKEVARENIGAIGRSELLPIINKIWNNYIEGKGQSYSFKQFYGFVPGHNYRIYFKNPNWDTTGITGDSNYKLVIRNDYNGNYTLFVGVYLQGTVSPYYDILIPQNSDYITIGGLAASGSNIEFYIEDITDTFIGWHEQTIFSINHRGYSLVAPENTLPAFILSKKRGFAYVETDVAFTSDNVAVLMHDSTINRTGRNQDGTEIASTVYIYDITYEDALDYDFGIWMGAEWAGTPIPTFTQFIQLCKQLSIHPFIELKNSITWTEARCNIVANAIKAVGMERNVSFISFDVDALRYMTSIFPEATIGLGYQYVYDSEHFTAFVNSALSLRTSTNRVLISVRYSSMSSSLYEIADAAGINSIVWTVNSKSDAVNLNDNTVGVLSDSLNAGALILGDLFATLPFGL